MLIELIRCSYKDYSVRAYLDQRYGFFFQISHKLRNIHTIICIFVVLGIFSFPPLLEIVMSIPSILLVDDEPSHLRLLEVMLRMTDYRLLTATDGYKAMEICKQERPSLIFADVHMPVLDGIEFRRLLLEDADFSSVPFIFMSGYWHTKFHIEEVRLNCDAFLAKPFDAEDLEQVMTKVLSSSVSV
ncbi:response regulator [Prosthecochloris vibrioformis]|uniref:Response regulator n=2 Tax=Prosthecochloris vibrioformis TaxID=1098 RepID=A0A5C4S1J7_PROVB|nr:response regulator [Prosthecochloris vibrioformis]